MSTANGTIDAEYDLHEAGDIAAIRCRVNQNAPHIVTSTPADIVTFNTDLAAPIKKLRCEFLPVQEGSGDPSPDNVRPISGWTGIDVIRCGEQLINLAGCTISDGSKAAHSVSENTIRIIATSDNSTSMTQSSCQVRWNIPKCLIGKSVYVGCTNILNSNPNHDPRVIFDIRSKDGSLITDPTVIRSDTRMYKKLITIPENSSYANINFRIAANITTYEVLKDDYAEFSDCYISFSDSYSSYTGTTIPISWESEAGTVYGGYVDLVKGEVVATQTTWVLDPDNIGEFTWNGGAVYMTSSIFKSKGFVYPANVDTDTCSHLAVVRNTTSGTGPRFAISGSGNFAIKDYVTSIQEFKTAVETQYNNGTPITFCLRLATPIAYPITPQIIKSLRGVNNIWSDANGLTTVSYWTH